MNEPFNAIKFMEGEKTSGPGGLQMRCIRSVGFFLKNGFIKGRNRITRK